MAYHALPLKPRFLVFPLIVLQPTYTQPKKPCYFCMQKIRNYINRLLRHASTLKHCTVSQAPDAYKGLVRALSILQALRHVQTANYNCLARRLVDVLLAKITDSGVVRRYASVHDFIANFNRQVITHAL